MEMDILWSGVLTAALGVVSWWARYQSEEIKRLQILLNKTREEMVKDYISKFDSYAASDKVMTRLDRLEGKLDRLIEKKIGHD